MLATACHLSPTSNCHMLATACHLPLRSCPHRHLQSTSHSLSAAHHVLLAMRLLRTRHVPAACSPCACHVLAMCLPHVLAMYLLRARHGLATCSPCAYHVLVMCLPRARHVLDTYSPWACYVLAIACNACHVLASYSPCACHIVSPPVTLATASSRTCSIPRISVAACDVSLSILGLIYGGTSRILAYSDAT